MKIVYIVHPIAGDVMGNTEKIIALVRSINLASSEVVPFAPYLGDVLALDDNKPEERNRGIRNGIAIIRSGIVSEMWVYGPKISGGMEGEIYLAFQKNIPVMMMDPATEIPMHLKPRVIIGY